MKQWIMKLLGANVLGAIVLALAPEGGTKRVVTFAWGLVVVLTAASPLVDMDNIIPDLWKYELQGQELVSGVEVDNQEVMELIIQEKTAAYILDKAEQLGFSPEVEVTTERSSQGWPYPAGVTITGSATPEQKSRLSRILEEELALGPDKQEWS